MKFRRIQFERCVKLWQLTLACMITCDIAIAWHFNREDSLRSAILLAVAHFILLATDFVIHAQIVQRRKQPHLWHTLNRDMKRSFPKLAQTQAIAHFVIQPVLLIVTLVAVTAISWHGPLTVAFLANSIHCFELGERIFRTIPDFYDVKEDMSFSATWDFQPKIENIDKSEQELSDIIAKLYGAQSRQLAHRYLLIGEHFRASGLRTNWRNNIELSKQEFNASIKYYEKSLQIFQGRKDYAEQAECLSNIAYCQRKLGQCSASESTVKQALVVLASCEEKRIEIGTIDRLALTERLLENQNGATQLDILRKRVIERKVLNKKFAPNKDQIVLSILIAFFLSRILPTCLPLFYRCHLRKKLESAMTVRQKLSNLNNLITLELCLGNFKNADTYSQMLLAQTSRRWPN